MANKIGIEYSLREGFGSNKYMANTLSKHKVGLEEFAKKVASKAGGLSEINVIMVIELIKKELIEILEAGESVRLDNFLSISSSITGNFDSLNSKFDPKKHKVKINIIPSTKIVKELNSLAKPKRIRKAEKEPVLKRVCDLRSGTCNSQITAGSMVRLEGSNLSFDNKADDEGIFIYSASGDKAVKINYHDVMGNKELRFIVPPNLQELGDTVYIEVKSRMKTKTMRKGISECLLTVVSEE